MPLTLAVSVPYSLEATKGINTLTVAELVPLLYKDIKEIDPLTQAVFVPSSLKLHREYKSYPLQMKFLCCITLQRTWNPQS